LENRLKRSDLQAAQTLLLVEDEEVLRGLLREHLAATHPRIRVVEEGDGGSAWHRFRNEKPQFCVVDLRLPGIDGGALVQMMLESSTPPRILILTAQLNWRPSFIIRSQHILFFLDKTAPLEEFNRALRALIDRDAVEERRYQIARSPGPGSEDFGLTSRERQMVSLIGSGIKIRQIADMLGISPHTALTHRKNILRKLGIHSSSHLVRFAIENGLSVTGLDRQ
jgi:two-component system invasion response regulator UvrY